MHGKVKTHNSVSVLAGPNRKKTFEDVENETCKHSKKIVEALGDESNWKNYEYLLTGRSIKIE